MKNVKMQTQWGTYIRRKYKSMPCFSWILSDWSSMPV